MSTFSYFCYAAAMSETRAAARPRDARATKELLLEAATDEFAEFGLAGARIDRIAERAGANKRLLYVYFGDKDALFRTVIDRQTGPYLDAVTLDPTDLAAYAAARFDFMLHHPRMARLVAWRTFEGLEPSEGERLGFKAKVDAIARAQRDGLLDATIPALDLFALVLRMTEAWLSAPPALLAATGRHGPTSAARLRQHRGSLVEAVRRLTTSPTPPTSPTSPRLPR